jgi:hypothetical protein
MPRTVTDAPMRPVAAVKDAVTVVHEGHEPDALGDSGYFDDETCRLEPIDNPFGPKVLPMSPE